MSSESLRDSTTFRGAASSFDAAPCECQAVGPTVHEVYQTHFKYVHRHLTRLGVSVELVDDAAQDVFIVVHKKLHLFDGKVALTTWLYAIALRVARRYREAQGKKDPSDHRPKLDAVENPERDVNTRLTLEIAQRALDTLTDEKREVFVLSEIEQLSAPEIAEIMGTPIPTVYSRLRVAKEEFANAARRLQAPRTPR